MGRLLHTPTAQRRRAIFVLRSLPAPNGVINNGKHSACLLMGRGLFSWPCLGVPPAVPQSALDVLTPRRRRPRRRFTLLGGWFRGSEREGESRGRRVLVDDWEGVL